MSNCPQCSSPLPDGAGFCGVCGFALPKAAGPKLAKQRTMLGVATPLIGASGHGSTVPMEPMPAVPPPAAPTVSDELNAPVAGHTSGTTAPMAQMPAPRGGMAQTMLGVSPMVGLKAPAPQAEPTPAAAPKPAEPLLNKAARTMVGMAAPVIPNAGGGSTQPLAPYAAPAEAPPAAPAKAAGLGSTMLMPGVASASAPATANPTGGSTQPLAPYAGPAGEPAPAAPAGKGKTIVGMAVPFSSEMTPAASAASTGAPGAPVMADKGRTMVGVASPLGPPPAAAGQGSGSTGPAGKGKTVVGMAAPSMPGVAAPLGAGGSKKTLLGVAPGPLPVAPGKGKTIMGMAAPSMPSGKGKTLLGIAVPALLLPTVSEPEYVEEYYDEVEPGTGEVQRRVRMVEKPLPPLHRRPAFAALVGAVMLGVGGLLAVVLLKGPAPVTAEAKLDAEGRDVLHVRCPSCPDDTKLTLAGAEPGVVKAGEASLRLTSRLKVGDNEMALALDRPASGRDETVQLKVPVAYRISPDLNALQDTPPAVRVDVEAVPGSTVVVQGKPLPIDATGHGSTRIDVSAELLALPASAHTFERDIAYTIAAPQSSPASGTLHVRTGLASLTIDSPGSHLVADQPTFLLAGRTAKGGGVSVGGAPVAVGPDGAFKQYLKIPSMGEAEVPLRASAHGMAPRLLSLRVKLVPSLAAEAKTAETSGRPGFTEVASKLDSATGTTIAWRGEVVSATSPGNQAVAVIDVVTGCTQRPCRARVTWPGGTLSVGDRVGIYGRVRGITPGNERLPDIEADFVLLRQP